MRMPELKPENHAEIYDFFRNFEPNRTLQSLGFAAMHALYSSEVHYVDESNKVIAGHLGNGGSIIAAANHQSNADLLTIAGLIYEPCFAGLKGKVTGPGKAAVFGIPILGKHLFTHMRIHPVFRSKDFGPDEASQQLRRAARDSADQFNIGFINDGNSCALFPEGTRTKDAAKVREVQGLRPGIARIAMGIDEPERLLIVPMGFAYKSPKFKLRPLVVINEPFSPAGMTQDELLAETGARIQAATTEAFDLAA